MTPTMCCPSGVRSNLPLNVVVGRVERGRRQAEPEWWEAPER